MRKFAFQAGSYPESSFAEDNFAATDAHPLPVAGRDQNAMQPNS